MHSFRRDARPVLATISCFEDRLVATDDTGAAVKKIQRAADIPRQR
jgi:hypothetical protein